MNLASIIEPHPADSAALISRGKSTTYGQLRDQVAHLRGGLAGLGLEPGDRVAIICANNWYFVVSYLAALGAGLVAVPLNPTSPPREVERELAAIGARAVVVGPAGQPVVAGIDRSACPDLEHVIASGDASGGTPGAGDAISLDDLMGADPAPMVERDPDDLAVLVFTSGTAGHPKAAMLSHGNLASNLDQMLADDTDRSPDDVHFGVLPMFHIFGLNVVLGAACRTGAATLLVERFDPASALEAVERHQVTAIGGVPTMWAAWAMLPGASPEAMRSVRRATSGAARLSTEVADAVQQKFGLTLMEGYGLTEASPVVTSSMGLDPKPGSIGAPVDGVELRLVDPDGDDVLVGDSGELWVRGPNVFKGYWNDPEATRGVLDEDGWLHTGDIAVVDDDGYLFLVDRAKDLIIVSGFNVYPAEVEEVLTEHPGVQRAAVIGVAHPHTGEAVKAYVVGAANQSVEEDQLIEFCADRMARYKCPDKVMFVDELPEGVAGKVLRRQLREPV